MSNSNKTTVSELCLHRDPVVMEQLHCELAQSVVDEITSVDLRGFMTEVMSQPEPWDVLTREVKVNGQHMGVRLQLLAPMARQFRDAYCYAPVGEDVIYAATLLHGIECWLQDWVVGGGNVQDVMFTIARVFLHRLDASNPPESRMLRLCMGWGNMDEETTFTTWLHQRMQKTVRALDQIKM